MLAPRHAKDIEKGIENERFHEIYSEDDRCFCISGNAFRSLELVGLSPAVKDFNAILVNGLTSLTVECLPTDLPEKFVVDISKLAVIGNGIHVSDIVVPENVKVLDEPDEMIVVATAPAKEEVAEVVAGAPVEGGAAEPEVIEKGKKEEGEEEAPKA